MTKSGGHEVSELVLVFPRTSVLVKGTVKKKTFKNSIGKDPFKLDKKM